MIYLAHPYWSNYESTRKERMAVVREVAKELVRLHKAHVLAPCLIGSIVDECEAFGRDYWMGYSMALLKRAESILILPLVGWEKSEGLKREIFVARGLGMPIIAPAQLKLPHPGPEKATPAWYGGPEFTEQVSK